jgi:hypothetical protein
MQLHYSLKREDNTVIYNIISQEQTPFNVTLSIMDGRGMTVAQVRTENVIELNGSMIYLRGEGDRGSDRAFRKHHTNSVSAEEVLRSTSMYLDAYIKCETSDLKRGVAYINVISDSGSEL